MPHRKENTGIEQALEGIISNGVEGLESAMALFVDQ